jgi:hypothetical protein
MTSKEIDAGDGGRCIRKTLQNRDDYQLGNSKITDV